MKFIVSYFYRDGIECVDYVEFPTMMAAVDYAKGKAEENLRDATNFYWDNIPPFTLNDKMEYEIDQKMVREALDELLSFSVKEFDEANSDDVMVMWACQGDEAYVS